MSLSLNSFFENTIDKMAGTYFVVQAHVYTLHHAYYNLYFWNLNTELNYVQGCCPALNPASPVHTIQLVHSCLSFHRIVIAQLDAVINYCNSRGPSYKELYIVQVTLHAILNACLCTCLILVYVLQEWLCPCTCLISNTCPLHMSCNSSWLCCTEKYISNLISVY